MRIHREFWRGFGGILDLSGRSLAPRDASIDSLWNELFALPLDSGNSRSTAEPADIDKELEILVLRQQNGALERALADSQSEQSHPTIVHEAEERAESLLQQAEEDVSRILHAARDQIAELEREKAALESKIDDLRIFEEEYRTRLRTYLEAQLRDMNRQSASNRPPAISGDAGGESASDRRLA